MTRHTGLAADPIPFRPRRRPLVAFGPYRPEMALDVILGMRPADRAEVYATRLTDDPYALFAEIHAARPLMVWGEIVYDEDLMGRPLALFGVTHRSPGVGSAFLIATPELRPMQARAIAARVRRKVVPSLIDIGFRRVDCLSAETHREAHAFLGWCGATAESRKPGLGKRGEGFVEFVWLAEPAAQGRIS